MGLSVAESTTGTFATSDRSTTWPRVLTQTWIIALVATVVLGLGFRTIALDTYGVSEDEINKVWAIEAYRHGHFGANAEHPMLMKLAMWASVEIVGVWNHVAPAGEAVSLETAIRLPNALAGAVTSAALAAVGLVFFGPIVGITAGLLWALDPSATSISRLGKEDSFLLLFFLLAVACYEHAKRIGVTEPARATPWYTTGGALFGLMLASKYMPHFYGLHTLFQLLADRHPGANKPHKLKYYSAMAVAFLVMNFALLTPDTWHSLAQYVQGGRLVHHGYAYANNVFVNDATLSPLGVPSIFYVDLLITKTPLVVLAAAGLGLIELARRRRERGGLWLSLFLLLLIIPYSLMSGKFLRYALPMVALVDLLAAVGIGGLIARLERVRGIASDAPPQTTPKDSRLRFAGGSICLPRSAVRRAHGALSLSKGAGRRHLPGHSENLLQSSGSPPEEMSSGRTVIAAATMAVLCGSLLPIQMSAAPFYSLQQNSFGRLVAAPAARFPEETYDYGVREAVAAIVRTAQPGAVIVSDANAVVAHYLEVSNRRDLRSVSLSAEGLPTNAADVWVIVQDAHLYFENQAIVERLRQQLTPWREIRMRGALAVQVFHLHEH